jgi:predicted transcriptional regulator of viral defense system
LGHEKDDPTPQLHEFVVAMEIVSPAVIAYWSALNHHGMSEQLPRTYKLSFRFLPFFF